MNEAKAILRNYHALIERTYKGDMDALVAIVDLETAVERAGLTDRQVEALRLVYGEDLTQAKAGERMGITREAVSLLITAATDNIQAAYDEWKTEDTDEFYAELQS